MKGLERICTGDMIDAREAERIGMITKVVADQQLENEVESLANKLKSKSASILKLGLEGFQIIADMEYNKAIACARDMVAIFTNTHDSIEGTTAFAEKRKPVWRNS